LDQVRGDRRKAADAYFESVASHWENIRSHYVAEAEVEAQIVALAGAKPRDVLVDLGTGTGRMLRLLAAKAQTLIGLDLSQPMLNVARARAFGDGLGHAEFRHGDIYDTRLPDGSTDLAIAHQVLHFLSDPARAVAEAARILRLGGHLIIVDFAPHALEEMRDLYRHRRLGISDEDMTHWAQDAGLVHDGGFALPPKTANGLTVKGWRLRKA
jgi:ArsR family transcriptional regulator